MDDATFRAFISGRRWQFAKTMASIPHEYTVAAWTPGEQDTFRDVAIFIRAHGYQQRFFSRTYTYYDVDEFQYWTMDADPAVTTLVNRARRPEQQETP